MVVPERGKAQRHESMACLRRANQLSMATQSAFQKTMRDKQKRILNKPKYFPQNHRGKHLGSNDTGNSMFLTFLSKKNLFKCTQIFFDF